jgi:hypothetical protein
MLPNQEYTEPYIPVNENYGVLKSTPSINELSIKLNLASFQTRGQYITNIPA